MSVTLPELDVQVELAALRQELAALRQELAARPRVSLRAEPERPFLGQPLTITVAVTRGPDGVPAVGVPVTLVTTWGRLVPHEGADRRAGSSVSGATGLDGTLRAELQPATADDLAPYQRDLLAGALGLLDGAATPREAEPGLRGLARLYRQSGSSELRRAVDLYFRDFGTRARAAVERRDLLDGEWPTVDAALVAYVQVGDMQAAESGVLATATLAARFNDWLGPWLQTYIRLAGDEDRIGWDLANARDRGEPANPMLDVIYTRVRSFVGSHPGDVGEFAAQQVASQAMRGFLLSSNEVPLEVQTQLFPALETASAAMAAGASALNTLSRVRADLRGDLLDAKLGAIDVGQIGGLATQLDGIRSQIAAKVDQSALQSALASKVDAAALDQALASKVDRTEFNDTLKTKVDRTEFNDALKTKVDRTEFNDTLKTKVDQATFDQALATKVDQATFDQALATKVDQATFDQALATKVDSATFADALTTKVDQATFDQALATKVDSATFADALTTKVDQATFANALDRQVAGRVDSVLDRALPQRMNTALVEFRRGLDKDLSTEFDKLRSEFRRP